MVLIDGKGPLAEAALGMVPADRTVHYLDLAHPEIGFNPLQIGASPGATAAGVRAGADRGQPARRHPGRLRQLPAPSHRRRLRRRARADALARLPHARARRPTATTATRSSTGSTSVPGSDFARDYWRREFPALIGDRGFAAQALNPPRNKLERLISTRETDILLRHPVTARPRPA